MPLAETNLTGLSINGVSLTDVLVSLDHAEEGVGVLTGAISATAGNGGLISVANPSGEACIVLLMTIDVTTQATGAATADIGVAANGTTSSDTLMDGIDVGTAAIVGDNIEDGGTNGGGMRTWGSSQFITGTASADPAGLVGVYHIVYAERA